MAKDSMRPELSSSEKLRFILIIFRALSTTSWTLLNSPFRGKNGAPDLSKHVYYHAIRSINAQASARQLQSVIPSTEECYRAFAAAKGFQPETTTLAYGAKAHWLGDRTAGKILLFFHDGQYPLQLQQVTELLRYIIQDAGKKASNVIIGGDSAGGNLVLGVLSHLLHPHPSVPTLNLSERLRGAILLSPWVDFQMTAPSFTRNQHKDMVGERGLKNSVSYFMGSAEADEYNQPLRAEAEWWMGLKDVVREISTTAGADELMVDDIEAISKKIEAVHPRASTVITSGEGHNLPVMDRTIGWKVESQQEKAVKALLVELL